MVKSSNCDISRNDIQIMGYLCEIYYQEANKPLNAFNPDILCYTHRVTPPQSQLKIISFHLLNDLGHMSKFITIQHVNLFLLLFDTSLHMVQLDPDTIWF